MPLQGELMHYYRMGIKLTEAQVRVHGEVAEQVQ